MAAQAYNGKWWGKGQVYATKREADLADPTYYAGKYYLNGQAYNTLAEYNAAAAAQPADIPVPDYSSHGSGGFFDDFVSAALPVGIALALPGAGSALGAALGTSAAAGTALAGAGLGALQGASGEDLLKGAALGYAGGALGSSVAGATDSAALGQLAGGTASGVLSGKDLETSLYNAALNTGTQQVAQGLLASPSTTALPTPSSTDNYSVNADYSFNAPASSGLGLKAELAPLDMSNPYSFDTTLASTGGLGLNYGLASSVGNLSSMGGGQGLLGQNAQGKTLGEIGSAIENNLTNNITGQPLGQELAGITTGAENYLDTNPESLTSSTAGSNLLGKLLMASLTGGTGTSSTANNTALGSLFSGLLGGVGGIMQNRSNVNALTDYANKITAAGQQAQQQAMFRPVGTTTRFGTSNFAVDPTTGAVTANYNLSPEAQAYQNALGGMTQQGLMQGQQIQSLAGQYLGESPEAVRQRVIQQRMDLLAPSRERELAKILNTNYQTGTGGLSVGATGVRPGGGEGLRAANPRLEAYYNAMAQADRQAALEAETAAQNQIKFGQQLAGQAYDPFTAGFGAMGAVEKAGQQPLTLSTDIAKLAQQAGYQTGRLGVDAATQAGGLFKQADQTNTAADILGKLGTSTTAGNVLGGLLGNTGIGQSLGNWLSNLNYDQRLNQSASDWIAANPDIVPPSTFTGSDSDWEDWANSYAQSF